MTEAARITAELGGEWRGGQGLAPCPICQPEGRRDQRALSISEKSGRPVMYCHKSGCAIFQELMSKGIVERTERHDPDALRRQHRKDRIRWQKRTDYANQLFDEAICAEGTPVETYLRSRGLDGLKLRNMRRTLRFHPGLKHGPSGLILPAMLARIREVKGFPIGLHRTFLRHDGRAKADVAPNKMMIGSSAGGAVRFGPDAQLLVIAEGIETALSLSRAARVTCWAALSSSGLRGLVLPPLPTGESVIIAADHDSAGISAAEALAERLEAEGRGVSIIKPHRPGMDFNDVLMGRDDGCE